MASDLKQYLESINAAKVDISQIEKAFDEYDKDGSGTIEGDEVGDLAKAVLAIVNPSHSADDLPKFEKLLVAAVDADGDGKITRDELTALVKSLQ